MHYIAYFFIRKMVNDCSWLENTQLRIHQFQEDWPPILLLYLSLLFYYDLLYLFYLKISFFILWIIYLKWLISQFSTYEFLIIDYSDFSSQILTSMFSIIANSGITVCGDPNLKQILSHLLNQRKSQKINWEKRCLKRANHYII